MNLKSTGNKIILTSNEPWGDMWYSKQHYANELAKMGNTVYFIDPPARWKFSSLLSLSIKLKKVDNNLYIVRYRNSLPYFKGKFRKLNEKINSYKLYRKFGREDNLIFWFFDPFRFINLFFFKNYFKIFHVVDDYSNHSIDLELARSSDLIIVTSPVSFNRYTSIHKNVILVPHGVAEDDLQPEKNVVQQLQNNWGKYIIYIGGINKHLNFPMLLDLANELREYKIIFLGKKEIPTENTHRELMEGFFKKDNVIYPGLVHAKKLKNYIAGAAVCLIPYYPYGKSRAQTLKAINYLSQLKPMVTIELDDLKPFAENYIFMTENEKEYIHYVKEILEGKKNINTAKAKEYRDSIRYPNLIHKIFNHINEQG